MSYINPRFTYLFSYLGHVASQCDWRISTISQFDITSAHARRPDLIVT